MKVHIERLCLHFCLGCWERRTAIKYQRQRHNRIKKKINFLRWRMNLVFQDTDTLWLDYHQSLTDKCLTSMDLYLAQFPDIKVWFSSLCQVEKVFRLLKFSHKFLNQPASFPVNFTDKMKIRWNLDEIWTMFGQCVTCLDLSRQTAGDADAAAWCFGSRLASPSGTGRWWTLTAPGITSAACRRARRRTRPRSLRCVAGVLHVWVWCHTENLRNAWLEVVAVFRLL